MLSTSFCVRFDLLRRAAARFGNYPWLLTSEQDGGDGLVEITYRQVRQPGSQVTI